MYVPAQETDDPTKIEIDTHQSAWEQIIYILEPGGRQYNSVCLTFEPKFPPPPHEGREIEKLVDYFVSLQTSFITGSSSSGS